MNRRAALASVDIGLGRQGLIDLCSLLNMPPPCAKLSFQHIYTKLETELTLQQKRI